MQTRYKVRYAGNANVTYGSETALIARCVVAVVVVAISVKPVFAGQMFINYTDGKQFQVEIDDEDLLKTPVWSRCMRSNANFTCRPSATS
jgi:hypothetical protein